MNLQKEEKNNNSNSIKKLGAASISIYVNFFLTIIKFVVAILTNSLAIFAELLHSGFDLLASLFAYFGIKQAEKPADKNHHHGHEKFENISSLAQTILIFLTSIFIIYEAIDRIQNPQVVQGSLLVLIVMGTTIIIDFLMSKYLHKSSEKYQSVALEADAYHFTTDLIGAIAVIIGLIFVHFGYPIFDPIAAIVVAIIMIFISFELGKNAILVLSDGTTDTKTLDKISQIISKTKEVKDFHKLKIRHAGSKLLVETHILVKSNLTVKEGHKISHRVKRKLIKEIPAIKEVSIHIEPFENK